ncbi:MAG: periplasmic heavy metal sensor [Desulfamplus sp.]|nr:periplasmic heavy metal sensor [Desulfamplus sp.]
MKKQVLSKFAVVLTMITIAGTAFALEGADKEKKDDTTTVQNYGQAFIQDWGKLTDDQKNKLNKLHQQFTDETSTARASIIAKQEEIKVLMETTSPDKAKLKAVSNELTELQKQVILKEIDLTLEAKKIAPEINVPMGFIGSGKHGMMGNQMKCGMGGMAMMGNGNMLMGKGNMMRGKRMGMMGEMGKGMGKMHCPAMSSQDDTVKSNEKETSSEHNNHKSI